MLTNDNSNKCPSIFYNAFSDPLFVERVLLITYAATFLIGLVGNIMTIIIIKYNTHLRTPTNFYLLNLAVSDLMMLMCNLPLEMIEIHYRQWPLSIIFCKLRNISAEFFTCSSILTILAFTCERYFAIVQPIHLHRLSHFRRAQKVIFIIWSISLIFSVPLGLLYEIVDMPITTSSYSTKDYSKTLQMNTTIPSMPVYCKSCIPKTSVAKLLSIIMMLTSFCFFYLPMIIIGAIYFFIAKALRRVNKYDNQSNYLILNSASFSSYGFTGKKQAASTPGQSSIMNREIGNNKQQNTHLGSYSWLKARARCQARKVVVKTLVTVVIAFFVCYAPLYLQRFVVAIIALNSNLNHDSQIISNIVTYLYIISGTTFYFGSIINPILYNVVSNKYRRAFRDLFCCRLQFQIRIITRNPKKLSQSNHLNNQPIHYLVKTAQQPDNINTKICLRSHQQHVNDTRPIIKRLVLSNTQ